MVILNSSFLLAIGDKSKLLSLNSKLHELWILLKD